MPPSKTGASPWLIIPLAGALIVIGAKCWMISRFGNPTPFWDQWDAEGANLYPKYFDGTLTLSDLLAPHNEHRILLTRLWALLLLELEGYWDPILQMAANALLFGGFAALFIAAFRPLLAGADWLAFAAFAAVMLALPFGWENTLEGFNSQWYFLLLANLGGLLTIIAASAFRMRWWVGFGLLVVGYFCTAGGALGMIAAAAIGLVQYAAGPRRGAREVAALTLLALAAAVMLYGIPAPPHHAEFKAHSIGEFLYRGFDIASWPAGPVPAPLILKLPYAILINAPAAIAAIHIYRLRPPLADRQWLLPALAGWALLQMAAIAYGRPAGTHASRYFDLYLIAVLVNGASLLYLLRAYRPTWRKDRRALAAAALWLLLIGPLAAALAVYQSIVSIPTLASAGRAETENLRTFLASSDLRVLENKPRLEIPYPDPHRLAEVASQPVIRAILPPALVGEDNAARAQTRGLAHVTGVAVATLKDLFVRWGVLLIPLGLALFAVGIWRREPNTA